MQISKWGLHRWCRDSHANVPQTARATRTSAAPVVDPFGSISPERGFLPVTDPRRRLQVQAPGVDAWEQALHDIPDLAVAGGTNGRLRRALLDLPPFPAVDAVALDPQDLWRAYFLISFLAHAYMWCEPNPPDTLPAVLAQPWVAVSRRLDMPPVLVYATYNLLNWRRLDPAGPIELGNIVCLQNFMASLDESWFRLVHVEIEARAAPGLAALPTLIHAAQQDNGTGVERSLQEVVRSLRTMQATLDRMGEKCDPYIYYARVRQPMSGWRGNPALPRGLRYEGTTTSDGSPLRLELYGETGAQSSVIPAMDIVLGIQHEAGWLREYLQAMRGHMPPAHRAHLAHLQQVAGSPSVVRAFCARHGGSVAEAYNETVAQLEQFRSQHKAFAHAYIAKWAKQDPAVKGTGGSDFMPALRGYRDTTAAHKLPAA